MSAERRRVALAAFVAVALATAMPRPASAHAIEGGFQLPVPLWLYLLGAAVAVAASFVVTVVVTHRVDGRRTTRRSSSPTRLAAVLRGLLRFLGLAWWYGAIVVGFVVGGHLPAPGRAAVGGASGSLCRSSRSVAGNPWPSLSPFRTTFGALEWLARRLGVERLDAGLPYPPGLARWPAVALFAAGVWCRADPAGQRRRDTVAALMAGYTVLTLAGMVALRPGRLAAQRRAVRGAPRLARADRPGRPAVDEPRAVRRVWGGVLDRIGASTARSARPRQTTASGARSCAGGSSG